MTTPAKPRWDLLLVVTNERYGSEQFRTIRRFIDAAIDGGHSLQIWACGACNMLTQWNADQDALDTTDACCGGNDSDPSQNLGPATAEYLGGLLTSYPQRFSWVACRTCADERGGGRHIAGALTEPGFANFKEYVASAAKTVYIGGA